MRRLVRVGVVAGALVTMMSACGSEDAGPAPVPQTLGLPAVSGAPLAGVDASLCTRLDGPACGFDHGNFSASTVIDNEYLPLVPGTRFVFEGTTNEGELLDHEVVITVTDLTKVIDGIETVVSWDLDFSDGELVEAELAFFAQDDDGNVWRMGEYPEEYEDGELVDAPAWLAGVEGAQAGISMLGDPVVGTLSYSQGWAPAVEFIDRGQVTETGVRHCVQAGCHDAVLVVSEFNVLEAGAVQLKMFAPGVGNIAVDWGGRDTTREALTLVGVEQLDQDDLAAARAAALALEASAYSISPDVYGTTAPAE